MKKVMVFGTFDGIHEGHLDFFRQAKQYGDYLIAIIGRDSNILKIKNHLPLRSEQERLQNLRNCKLVDEVLLGHENDPYKMIEKIKPDIICLGYDQGGYAENLEIKLREECLNIKIFRLKAYKPKQFKSSILNK
jgi:FAD synthetase